METLIEEYKTNVHGLVIWRLKHCVESHPRAHRLHKKIKAMHGFAFLSAWGLLLTFCLAAWHGVILGASAYLEFLK